jgi:hypothetical protein
MMAAFGPKPTSGLGHPTRPREIADVSIAEQLRRFSDPIARNKKLHPFCFTPPRCVPTGWRSARARLRNAG